MWKALQRQAIPAARGTVARLMRQLGLRGVVRGQRVRTTVADRTAQRPDDLVQRAFTAHRPNVLWAADVTYVATWRGVVYVAFVIDVCSRRIVGWRAARSMRTDLALDALAVVLRDCETDASRVHQSDRSSQYVSIRYTERLAAAGIEASVGRRGDACVNALADTAIGLFKTEVLHHGGPWRSFDDVEYATLAWIA